MWTTTLLRSVGIAASIVVIYTVLKVFIYTYTCKNRKHTYVHSQIQFGDYAVLGLGVSYVIFDQVSSSFRKKKNDMNKKDRPIIFKTSSNVSNKKHHDVTCISRVRGDREGKYRNEDQKEARRRRRKVQRDRKARKKMLIQRHRNAQAKRNYCEKSSLSSLPGITGVIMRERLKNSYNIQ